VGPPEDRIGEPIAEWTPHPIAERAISDERRQTVGNRRVGWALAVAALVLCPLSCIGASFSVVGSAFPYVAVVLLGALGVEKLRRGARTTELAHAKRQALRDEYAGINGWAVELTVFQGAAPTGRDRGMLWFEDGRLFFVGERTSFGLAPPQVEGGMREEWPLSGLRATSTLSLGRRTVAGAVSLGLDFIPSDLGPVPPLEKAFRRALDDWLHPSKEGRSGEGQLPPLAIGPDAPTLRALLASAVASTVFWLFLAGGLILLAIKTAWWIVPPVVAFLGVILVLWSDIWAPRLRWLAWRDRRKLERRRLT